MDFKKSDLLAYEEIIELFNNVPAPTEQGKLLSKKLNKYIVIKDGKFYQLQTNITYICDTTKDIDEQLLVLVADYLNQSHKLLSLEQQAYLSQTYKKTYEKFRMNSAINLYLKQLKYCLTNNKLIFDNYKGQIHFNNGYIDLKTKEFKKRIQGQDFVINVIDRDYKKSTDKKKEKLMKIFSQIIPINEDRNCMLFLFGATLTGNIAKEQGAMFFIGLGSAGKSTLLEITSQSLPIYCIELKSDTFTGSETNTNKILNTYEDKKQIRFTFINEFDDKKVNTSIFKTFCEGKIATVKLFKDGSFNSEHNSLCISAMNELPNFRMDTGVKRRLNAYEFKSTFVDDPKDVNEEKHIYLKDKNFKETIQPLLNAWVDILVDAANEYLNGKKLEFTNNFNKAKDGIVNSVDIVQDFIDTKLTLTNKPEDRIGKDEMRTAFLEMYPDKHLTVLQVISSLKDKKIIFDGSLNWYLEWVKLELEASQIITRVPKTSPQKYALTKNQ